MQRIVFSVEYQGQNYHGFQRQKEVLSIQEVLENAISKVANHQVEIFASGRTDKGVHALAQIVHFDTTSIRTLNSWLKGVNSYLPNDIVITSVHEVSPNFHARHSVERRFYRYVLIDSPIRPCILYGKIGWVLNRLNLEAMKEAANFLCGTHDFSSFRSSECQSLSPIKTMFSVDIYRFNEFICFDFEANGFLHHMIRNIIGALIKVGYNHFNIEKFYQLLMAKNRSLAPATFMPDGLYLAKILYPNSFKLEFPQMPTWFWGKKL